jgi:kynureninase
MEELKQQDQQDPLNWTRGEFEIPSARACGAEVGEWNHYHNMELGLIVRWGSYLLLR